MLLSISLNHDSPGLADGGGDLAATRGSTVRPAWRRAPVGQAGPLSGGPKRVRRAGASGRRPGRGRRAAAEASQIGVTLTQECVTDVATEPPGWWSPSAGSLRAIAHAHAHAKRGCRKGS
jgi:hypothetical protein